MPDSSIALPLAKLAWPLAWVSSTGLSGDTRRATRASGKPSTFGVGARRPLLLVPAAADRSTARASRVFTASATIATISSQLVVVIRFRLQLRFADAGEVAVPLDEAGDDELPLQVDDLRRRADVRLDLGRCAERHDPIAAIAIACASGCSASTVTILPLVRTRSAGCTGGCWTVAARSGRGRGC